MPKLARSAQAAPPGVRPTLQARRKPRQHAPKSLLHWSEWVHRLGAVISAIAATVIFVFGLKYTIEPIYKRAILEEQVSRLEQRSHQLTRESKGLEDRLRQMSGIVEQTNKRSEVLEKDLADALSEDQSARRTVALRAIARTLNSCLTRHEAHGSAIACLDTTLRSAFDQRSTLGQQVIKLVSSDERDKLAKGMERFIADIHATELIDDSAVQLQREQCKTKIAAAESAVSAARAAGKPPEVIGAVSAQLHGTRASCTVPSSIGEMENAYRKQHWQLVPRYVTLWDAFAKRTLAI